MEQPIEPGHYWYKEPGGDVKICIVFLESILPDVLKIRFVEEGHIDFPLSVIEPGTQFQKIEEWKF